MESNLPELKKNVNEWIDADYHPITGFKINRSEIDPWLRDQNKYMKRISKYFPKINEDEID